MLRVLYAIKVIFYLFLLIVGDWNKKLVIIQSIRFYHQYIIVRGA